MLPTKFEWELICNQKNRHFHGDLHFENLILSKDGQVKFLDWRQNLARMNLNMAMFITI